MPDPTQPIPPQGDAAQPHTPSDALDNAFLHELTTTDWSDEACRRRWLLLTPDEKTASRETLMLVFLAQQGSAEGLARMLLNELRAGPPGIFGTFSFLGADEQALVMHPDTPQSDAQALFLQRMMPFLQAKLAAHEQRAGEPFRFGR